MADSKEMVCTFYVQAAGREHEVSEITQSCIKDYEVKTGRAADALDVYINIDKNAAFYVADGQASDEYSVAL